MEGYNSKLTLDFTFLPHFGGVRSSHPIGGFFNLIDRLLWILVHIMLGIVQMSHYLQNLKKIIYLPPSKGLLSLPIRRYFDLIDGFFWNLAQIILGALEMSLCLHNFKILIFFPYPSPPDPVGCSNPLILGIFWSNWLILSNICYNYQWIKIN